MKETLPVAARPHLAEERRGQTTEILKRGGIEPHKVPIEQVKQQAYI